MSLLQEWSRHRCIRVVSCQLDSNELVTVDAMLPAAMACPALLVAVLPAVVQLVDARPVAVVHREAASSTN